MPQKNDLEIIEITGMTHEGNGVGRLSDGMAVFVPSAAQGDRLSVRIVKMQKSFCYGRLEEILAPSPSRCVPDCAVASQCGGCAFRHISYEAELAHKQAFVEENMRRIGGFSLTCEPILPSPEVEGYRNKAQYPIRTQAGTLAAGFFAPRSHRVVNSHACRLQPPVFEQILETALDYMRENGVEAYDEATCKGVVRHLYLRRGARSGEMMVCVVANAAALPAERQLVERLCACDERIVSILLNQNTDDTNVILGKKQRVLFGKETIDDLFCGLQISIAAPAFYQVNSPAAERLYALAAEYAQLTGNERLLDLYCGAGTIGLSMAKQVKELIGVEIVPQAVENARHNAAVNGVQNARFLRADAAQAAAQLAREGTQPNVVVLDPPRKGCDAATLAAVAQMNPQRIVYISCNSATLARDAALLCESGYTLSRCRPVDLFPRTAHVEACALLVK